MRDGASYLQRDAIRPDPGGRFALVAARFNQDIVDLLIKGCIEGFSANGIVADRVDLYWTPGAFELPTVCGRLARAGRHRGIIALGTVIRGETAHFEFVAGSAARGLVDVGVQTGVPTIFGVLTTETHQQALDRACEGEDNHGYQWACSAIDMANLVTELDR